MKKILYIYFAINLIQLPFSKAQNLVPNYSFEIHTLCGNFNRIYYAVPWFQPCIYSGNTTNSSSSDMLSACAPTLCNCGIPLNNRGFQFARTDTSYAGIYTYADTANIREYIEVSLITSFIANNTYCVEYYVSFANNSGIAISNMGAYFSVDSLLVGTYHAIDSIIPQIENPLSNMLNDTTNWMLVSGNFVATGGEKFMTIGNFHNPVNTNKQVFNSAAINRAYYYIDDVSVVDCTGVGVSEVSKKNNFKLYPNPTNGNFTLESHLAKSEIGVLCIYDIAGKLIKRDTFNSINSSIEINVSELNEGIYFYSVFINNTNVKTDKLIIIK